MYPILIMSESIALSNLMYTLLAADSTKAISETTTLATNLKMISTLITGGAFGSILTILYNRFRGKIQTMECYYIDDDVISKLPVTVNEKEIYQNIYSKQFELKNTTNTDFKLFNVIFEFDVNAKILRHTDTTKSGVDRLKKKLLKPNEYTVTIKNFNRNDKAKFIFEIANITEDLINITEDNCIGFKIKIKDKRKRRLKSKMTVVDKDRKTLNNNPFTYSK
jgi:hypothetical protein